MVEWVEVGWGRRGFVHCHLLSLEQVQLQMVPYKWNIYSIFISGLVIVPKSAWWRSRYHLQVSQKLLLRCKTRGHIDIWLQLVLYMTRLISDTVTNNWKSYWSCITLWYVSKRYVMLHKVTNRIPISSAFALVTFNAYDATVQMFVGIFLFCFVFHSHSEAYLISSQVGGRCIHSSVIPLI